MCGAFGEHVFLWGAVVMASRFAGTGRRRNILEKTKTRSSDGGGREDMLKGGTVLSVCSPVSSAL